MEEGRIDAKKNREWLDKYEKVLDEEEEVESETGLELQEMTV